MRLFEFSDDDTSANSGLATVLSFLSTRIGDEDSDAEISTQSLINMVKNSGDYFDYDALVAAYDNDPTIKNLIKDFNKDIVTLKLPGDEETDDHHGDDSEDSDDSEHGDFGNDDEDDFDDMEQHRDVVGDMSKRALNRSPNF